MTYFFRRCGNQTKCFVFDTDLKSILNFEYDVMFQHLSAKTYEGIKQMISFQKYLSTFSAIEHRKNII